MTFVEQGARTVTDLTLKSWLNAGPVDRSVGNNLMFVASDTGARAGRASWILCYRFGGRKKEKVLGRYPEISLREAREIALRDRALIQQGVDVAALKRREKLKARETHNVIALALLWYEREIEPRYKHPESVERVIRRHIKPAIGRLPVEEIRPIHIDNVLARIVAAGAPTVANDARRHLHRMFHFAVKRKWIGLNPVDGFSTFDAGGTEKAKSRWLPLRRVAALLAKVEVQVMPLTAANPVRRFAQQAGRAPHLVLLCQAGIGDGRDLDGSGLRRKEQLGIGIRQAPEREPLRLNFDIAKLKQAPQQREFHLRRQRLLHPLVLEPPQQILPLRLVQARGQIVQHGL